MATNGSSTPPPSTTQQDGATSDPWWKPSLAGAVTVVSLIAFFAFVIYLLPRTGLDDLPWTRSMYLLTGVEAITFAAVGWLFGKEVHRAQAQQAEKRADAALQQKDDAVAEAAAERAKGAALGELIYAAATEAAPPTEPGGPFERRGVRAPGDGDAANGSLAALAALAVRLYPEVGARR